MVRKGSSYSYNAVGESLVAFLNFVVAVEKEVAGSRTVAGSNAFNFSFVFESIEILNRALSTNYALIYADFLTSPIYEETKPGESEKGKKSRKSGS